MNSYINAVKAELKDWKKTLLLFILTAARIIYGWSWVSAGWEKATSGWFNFQGGHSAKLIAGMAANMLPPKAHGFDPLYINKLWSWVAIHIFNGMPSVTDFLVPICEIIVGVGMIIGFRLLWVALLGLFLNVQFITSGSANNFGYIWTDVIVMNFAKYFELIGLSGYLAFKKGQQEPVGKRIAA
ncbi:DoxX family membrane protein [Desulfosporosinus sp. PR]|uniref:DoxX family membrane protein n=1 Tax=Candidatus Desulfosporosinus nitrosoreducens TaxID=3401928 RepID=UPI0027F6CB93|nr:DoxX family membrane protein [Desulfosporosinus sp. PR]MDQ7094458.1 DoxX family membrane protein [Desulfosporosinus sp. PR]